MPEKLEDQMSVFEACITRRSIREYLEREVPMELVGTILEAGKAAPSSGNLQNWKFILVRDAGTKKALAEASMGQHWMAKAPVHIVISADLKKGETFYGKRGAHLYAVQNCAAAAENMLLTAHSLGLGACWVGAFDEEKVAELCGIPDESRPQVIVTLGYSLEKPDPPIEFPMEIAIAMESWGNRIGDINEVLGYHSDKVQRALKAGRDLLDKFRHRLEKTVKRKK